MVGNTLDTMKHYLLELGKNWEVNSLVACIIATLSSWTGLSVMVVSIFCASMIGDFILGIAVAILYKKFKCYRLRRGVAKMIIWSICIILAHGLDIVFSDVMDMQIDYICEFTVAYIVFTDVSSIIKHLRRLNLPVPSVFVLLTEGAKAKINRKIYEFIGEDGRKGDRCKEVEKVEDEEK